MRKRLTILLAYLLACAAAFAGDRKPVVIFYENDVHCHVDGYSRIAALRDATPGSLLVSCGDFVQGGSLGAVSDGGYIIEIMNAARYDVVTLGNHEFDYGMARLHELTDSLKADVVDCNLYDLRTGERMYRPYVLKEVNGVKVAFVGITTPYSFVSSTPAYFQEDGKYVYSLSADNFYETVQAAVNDAREDGADYVVALSHLGIDPQDNINSLGLISNTTGFDVVLDAHSHSTIPCKVMEDAAHCNVVLSSTGCWLTNIGKLTVSPGGRIVTELVPTSLCSQTDPEVDKVVAEVKQRYAAEGARVVFTSSRSLPAYGADSPRASRLRETGLGDFCADAMRWAVHSDIAIMNGGSIREGLPKGKVTFNDIFTMFPFGNTVVTVPMTGAQILDMLEFSAMALPAESGGFLQVSGMKFVADTGVKSPVQVDSDKSYLGVRDGQRRIHDVYVLGSNGRYEPLDLQTVYMVAGPNYLIKEKGDGYTMLGSSSAVDSGLLDLQVLENYVNDALGGVIPGDYHRPEGRIKLK